MKAQYSIIMSLFLFVSTMAQLPDDAIKSMQDRAPEKLFVTIVDTEYDTTISDHGDSTVTCTVKAKVNVVNETANGIEVGDTITALYTLYDNWGQLADPYVATEDYVPAFLQWHEDGYYGVAADNYSFHMMSLESNKFSSLVLTDSLWYGFRESKLVETPPLGHFTIEKVDNNILIYLNDSLYLRCYCFVDTLFVSPETPNVLKPVTGRILRKGSILDFVLDNGTDDRMMFIVPDEKTVELSRWLYLYSRDIKVRFSSFDPRTERALLCIWGENSYRNATIGYGQNLILTKEKYGLFFTLDSVSKVITIDEVTTGENTSILDSLSFIESSWVYPWVEVGGINFHLDTIVEDTVFMKTELAGRSGSLKKVPSSGEFTAIVGDTVVVYNPSTMDTVKIEILEVHYDTAFYLYNTDHLFLKKLQFGTSTPIKQITKKNFLHNAIEKEQLKIVSLQGRVLFSGEIKLAELSKTITNLQLANGIYLINGEHFRKKFTVRSGCISVNVD